MNGLQNLDHPTLLPPPDLSGAVLSEGPSAADVSTAARRPKRRRWWIIAGAIALGVAVLGVVGLGLDQMLTHDLLSADFSEGDDTFKTGETDQYALDVNDGSYQLTATATPTSPLFTFGWFARTAYYVDIEATIVSIDADGAIVGIECVHSASGDTNAGYVLMYVPGDGYVLAKVSEDNNGAPEILERVSGAPPAAGDRIGISCGVTSPLPTSKTTISGTINGAKVISATDKSYDSFEAAALTFFPLRAGDSVQFDNVIATVPGE
jgi:hypothetical protein